MIDIMSTLGVVFPYALAAVGGGVLSSWLGVKFSSVESVAKEPVTLGEDVVSEIKSMFASKMAASTPVKAVAPAVKATVTPSSSVSAAAALTTAQAAYNAAVAAHTTALLAQTAALTQETAALSGPATPTPPTA